MDVGPSGVGYASKQIFIGEKTLLVHELKTFSNKRGAILWVPTSLAGYGSTNGAFLRAWISESPGSRVPVSSFCARAGQNSSLTYTIGGGTECNLNANTTYYFNMQECLAGYDDLTCSTANEFSNAVGAVGLSTE